MIRPLVMRGEHSAFDLARLFYAQYATLNFEDDLVDYMRNGYVIAQPQLFVMFKAIHYEGERIWFVRMLIGNLLEAVARMPCLLPKICFCRNNQADKMVVVNTDRLVELAKRTAETKETA
jgi:hypothetical protein